jgi:hypothetical protein
MCGTEDWRDATVQSEMIQSGAYHEAFCMSGSGPCSRSAIVH